MRRYWVPAEWIREDEVSFAGDIHHHIFSVCRQKVGSRFEVLCGDQKAHLVHVTDVHKKVASAKIIETREIPPLAKPYIHLVLSLPKFATADWVMEKAVEMGAHTVWPVVSDFSFVRSVDQRLEKKAARWEKIIRGATQQSGRGDELHLEETRPLSQCLKEFQDQDLAWGLFAYEGESVLNIRQALIDVKARSADISSVWVFVGSEGGFSESEVEEFARAGLESVSLGAQVLRVDTACLALLSVIKYEFGLMGVE